MMGHTHVLLSLIKQPSLVGRLPAFPLGALNNQYWARCRENPRSGVVDGWARPGDPRMFPILSKSANSDRLGSAVCLFAVCRVGCRARIGKQTLYKGATSLGYRSLGSG